MGYPGKRHFWLVMSYIGCNGHLDRRNQVPSGAVEYLVVNRNHSVCMESFSSPVIVGGSHRSFDFQAWLHYAYFALVESHTDLQYTAHYAPLAVRTGLL